MGFKYVCSEEFEKTLKKLFKKNKPLYKTILKKIEEIISRDLETINFYKNLRNDLNDFKRVHVYKHYVLFFRVFRKEKKILFQKIRHHDEAYE
ncbi:MAG: type II toxin-antitoxin system RelE/ParE family toxin [Candidatus ainarchaeum sp.]|nr:type II toxin-antitoxin system RelE/ParE family toxin [Candidatus ainarchaeum sp.]